MPPSTSPWYPEQPLLLQIHLQTISRGLSRLASLLSWSSPAYCNHTWRLFWSTHQLSLCLQLKTFCQSHPLQLSLRPKWTPNFSQFSTINCPPNWICCPSWQLAIRFHWIAQRLWATFTKTKRWICLLSTWHRWRSTQQWWWNWSHTDMIFILDQHHQHLRWSTLQGTNRDLFHTKRKWPYTSKSALNLHHQLILFIQSCSQLMLLLSSHQPILLLMTK